MTEIEMIETEIQTEIERQIYIGSHNIFKFYR